MLDDEVSKKWQELWDMEPADKWARKLIPGVTNKYMALVERPNFLLSQAVTGHGAFSAYLCNINKRTHLICPCGNASQDAEHVFRNSLRYATGRPEDWDRGILSGDVRQYLITTMKAL